jgi:sialate O-acetylesterase
MCSTKSRFFEVVCVVVLVFTAVAAAERLRLPKVFSDHMVLQRRLPVVIWGWADTGEKVTVSFAGQSKSARADSEGRWRIELSGLKASAKADTLKVKAGDETVVFGDVLVGEVWLCSGQSNMEWTVAQSNDAEKVIAEANYPMIRHIKIERVMLPEPAKDVATKNGWEVCSPETVASFTGAGYFFGKELSAKLDVPIGLVNSSWGGSTIEAFTSLDGFKQVPELSDMVRRIESSLPKNDAYKQAVQETIAKTRQWIIEAREALNKDVRVPAVPGLPKNALPLLHWMDPANKHNAMIEGLAPYRIRGSIWYQGEANRKDGMLYVKKTQALLEGWRKAWGQPDLPFYYVQITPYLYGKEDPEILAKFWEAQAAIENEIPNTGMVVINDVGNLKDIHPKDKKTAGHRLAVQALANTYGMDIVAGGPRFDKIEIEGSKVRVFFKRTGSGLVTSDGKNPDWFEIAGEDGIFVSADAAIDGRTVLLSNSGIEKPAAMRYAWSKLAEPNLKNKEGFPVSAFRAGK